MRMEQQNGQLVEAVEGSLCDGLNINMRCARPRKLELSPPDLPAGTEQCTVLATDVSVRTASSSPICAIRTLCSKTLKLMRTNAETSASSVN